MATVQQDFRSALGAFGITPRGVVHVGAHQGGELKFYRAAGFGAVHFVEADPATYAKLIANVGEDPIVTTAQVAISDHDGVLTFYQASMDQSSSTLPPKLHQDLYSSIRFESQIEVACRTLSRHVEEQGLDLSAFNFLVADVQGAELNVLKGCGAELNRFDAVYVEANIAELYENGAEIEEIDAYLFDNGFIRIRYDAFSPFWGDAFYVAARFLETASTGPETALSGLRRGVIAVTDDGAASDRMGALCESVNAAGLALRAGAALRAGDMTAPGLAAGEGSGGPLPRVAVDQSVLNAFAAASRTPSEVELSGLAALAPPAGFAKQRETLRRLLRPAGDPLARLEGDTSAPLAVAIAATPGAVDALIAAARTAGGDGSRIWVIPAFDGAMKSEGDGAWRALAERLGGAELRDLDRAAILNADRVVSDDPRATALLAALGREGVAVERQGAAAEAPGGVAPAVGEADKTAAAELAKADRAFVAGHRLAFLRMQRAPILRARLMPWVRYFTPKKLKGQRLESGIIEKIWEESDGYWRRIARGETPERAPVIRFFGTRLRSYLACLRDMV